MQYIKFLPRRFAFSNHFNLDPWNQLCAFNRNVLPDHIEETNRWLSSALPRTLQPGTLTRRPSKWHGVRKAVSRHPPFSAPVLTICLSYYSTSICRGATHGSHSYFEALESFPSGHTAAAFSAAAFLTLYLNAKLKVLANHQPPLWAYLVLFAPALGASILAGTVVIDAFHGPADVTAGALIGFVAGVVAYRTMFAAVLDWRWNHIPLARGYAFEYGADDARYAGFYDAVATRRAGWGTRTGVDGGDARPVRERERDSESQMATPTGGQVDGCEEETGGEDPPRLDSVRRMDIAVSPFDFMGPLHDEELGIPLREVYPRRCSLNGPGKAL